MASQNSGPGLLTSGALSLALGIYAWRWGHSLPSGDTATTMSVVGAILASVVLVPLGAVLFLVGGSVWVGHVFNSRRPD